MSKYNVTNEMGKVHKMKFTWYDYVRYLPMAIVHALIERKHKK